MERMSHFPLSRWSDYVRGLGSEPARRAMRRHLDAGCRRCAGRLAAMERMAALATADAGPAPPAAARRSVKALMALHHPQRRSWLDAVGWRLRRDSAREPALVGTRSGDSAGRQLLFEADGCALDLSVEPIAGTDALAVTGSCLRAGGEPLAGAAVVAMGDGRLVDRATTDELGGFAFEGLPPKCELWLFAERGRPLVAALDPSG